MQNVMRKRTHPSANFQHAIGMTVRTNWRCDGMGQMPPGRSDCADFLASP
jgi:hypothetical protein